MNTEKLEKQLKAIATQADKTQFIYDLLLAYQQPKASVTRLQKGDYNLAKTAGDILWKQKLFFRASDQDDLHEQIDQLQNDRAITDKHPRFIVLTDFQVLLAVDTKTADTLDIALTELHKHYDFFLPWAGMEKTQYQSENPADRKAAEKMGRLYDLILQNNVDSGLDRHALNVFLSRLLFCFFAEDTGIFDDGQFTNAIGSHTNVDGSDMQTYLQRLFRVLNTRNRKNYPAFLQDFPYVNGGLFAEDMAIPVFSSKARKIILECGELNWKAINPDIFGSMMQAVVHADERSHLGMHYTSVVNIMKVIEPLFLNDLYEAFEKAEGNEKQLAKLLDRLYHLRIFDPACGSGNFLIIAYKELCKLEIKIFRQLQQLSDGWKTARSGIKLTQFYGIEIDDYAHETAKLSLWLAEHQMNLAFKEVFGGAKATLPLQDGGNIVCENATKIDWEVVCPKDEGIEIYILGNPPYLGFSMQDAQHKADMKRVFAPRSDYKRLDLISCWFWLAANYASASSVKYAFVSTNSICQGEQVSLIWPHIYKLGLDIYFAYQSFRWTNNAKGNAGVTCVVIGVAQAGKSNKKIYTENTVKNVENINPYLTSGSNLVVAKRGKKPLTAIPPMLRGDMPIDGGQFILTEAEKNALVATAPKAEPFLRKFIGASEFMKSTHRWCLWIKDNCQAAKDIPEINVRVEAVRAFRECSKNKSTQLLAETPCHFGQIRHLEVPSIIVPRTTSERRTYIPLGFLESDTIASDLASTIPYDSSHVFAVISSLMHMTWVRTVAGGLETRIRYSSNLCYNTFPFPNITQQQKDHLEEHVFNVLDEREKHPEKTMAQLYDPDKMPEGLRKAHHEMDLAVERCYRKKPFTSDEERLEYLFKLYEEMIAAEKAAA